MSCIIKIQEARSMLTETELVIAEFVLENQNMVVNSSAQKLAKLINTSPSAIIRFSKKIGYDGFPQLKIELAQDMVNDSVEIDNILDPHEDMPSLIKKVYKSNLSTIEKTYGLMNSDILEKVASEIINSHNVYLFGIGSSGIVCEDFHQKLLRVGRTSDYHPDVHVQLISVPNMQCNDLAFFVSYSGKTKEIVTAAKWAKKMGIKSAAITQSAHNDLGKLVDYVMTIPSEEKEVRIGAISSRFSSLLITDLLYYEVARNDQDETRKRLKQTKDIIKDIQK